MSEIYLDNLKEHPEILEKILVVVEEVEKLMIIAPDAYYAHGNWYIFEKRGVDKVEAQNIVHKWITEDGVEMRDNDEFSISLNPDEIEYIEKLKARIKLTSKKNPNNKQEQRLVEFTRGRLKIENHPQIEFTGKRNEIVNFFYNSSERKSWKTYDDIKKKVSDYDTETIRKAIQAINKRVSKCTDGEYSNLIEEKSGVSFNDPKRYRWAL